MLTVPRRFILINPEENGEQELQYRVYPHLGMLYVGTVAEQEGYEVVLWDELIQGHADLSSLIQPGDIVGLSMIVSGASRGLAIAHQAKEIGAKYVFVGNDTGIFRAKELLSSNPIDAVFTKDDLTPLRRCLQHLRSGNQLETFSYPGVKKQTDHITNRSNKIDWLKQEMKIRKNAQKEELFLVPNLNLYDQSYWKMVWGNYQKVFGHKHNGSYAPQNALALFAHGCTRTMGCTACKYCGIAEVANLARAKKDYLSKTIQTYQDFGINTLFNVTDSSFEMGSLANDLITIGTKFESMTMYGRAQGIAQQPQLLEKWLSLVNDRLLLNVGMDSGDATILAEGIGKSSKKLGESRLAENRLAVMNVAASGAHLHYSLIFGSPGETVESCEKSLEFLQWTQQVLGSQLDQVESDIWWLNHGAPIGQIFYNYEYAKQQAALAKKHLSKNDWRKHFASVQNEITVPFETEYMWYKYFTNITLDQAMEYNEKVIKLMTNHKGSLAGRAFLPKK